MRESELDLSLSVKEAASQPGQPNDQVASGPEPVWQRVLSSERGGECFVGSG